jgi:hypothetical protein
MYNVYCCLILFCFELFFHSTIIFNCSLPILIPLGTIFILYITFCNAKLNSIGDSHPVAIVFYFQKRGDSVPSMPTAFLVFCTHVLHTFINFTGI